MLEGVIFFSDGTTKDFVLKTQTGAGITKAIFDENIDFKTVEYIDISLNQERIKAGEDGFFILPGGWWNAKHHDTAMGYFKEHDDFEYIVFDPQLYVIGINHNKKAYIAIASGMREISHHYVRIINNEYCFGFRFAVDCETPYEDISVEIRNVGDDLSYSAMGREYRKYALENGFVSIKDRLTPELEYAAEAMCIRVRMGWKPVPCIIMEQTEENEPPMHVACSFKQVEELMYAYKAAGIEKAEFCLVGWNIKGHDGRWPQIMPPEESLGGEKDLRELITAAKKLGYTMTCHTNSTDAYRIGNNFDENDIARKKDGSFSIEAEKWAGGRTYNLCPKKTLKLAYETLPSVAELGFYGNHYIDVITATPPRYCYHLEHPVNRKEACECFDELFEYSAVSNRNPDAVLRLIELGGRPVLYYYSKFFTDGSGWMGDTDFRMDTQEDFDSSVANTKKTADLYKEFSYLQFEFMDRHEKIGENCYRIVYSDGTAITVDYNKKLYSVKKVK